MREALSYALVAGAVWLGWEAIKTPLADRSPPAVAVRLSPGSPEVLRRAAEAELLAERFDNAQALSAESLSRAPFNARALRVRGLAEARLGDTDRADEMLTLAGNWSLRDDPAHAWLIENRLRRGDYGSAFAHADTLARRRSDLYPSLFRLFTEAAVADPRALPVVASLLSKAPPWRPAYLEHLHDSDNGAPVVGGLAIALERTQAPFTPYELQRLYTVWLTAGRFDGILELRRHLGRPPAETLLQNGDFSTSADQQLLPFGWAIATGAGIGTSVVEDDLRKGNQAFRLEYDGFASGLFTRQLLMLDPGAYLLQGEWRAETPRPDMRIGWQVVCAETGEVVSMTRSELHDGSGEWNSFQQAFSIPRENCRAQWLQLVPVPGDRRITIAAWFDKLQVRPSASDAEDATPAAERGSPANSET
ncbi:tetratricopeptide repeat protein [Brevundimonas sp.]|uniref:tetratricopeptide repeat protein n=1 Tax=Brevundimonas sp. TaxID=1871086 RepID=UPI0035B3AD4D